MTYNEIFGRYLYIDPNQYVKDLDLDRLITPFQIIPFEEKILQNYLTSINIRFGNALEAVVKQYLIERGAQYIDRHFISGKDCDQLFTYNGKTVLIEQKVRDDHDSTKKVGQIENYLDKKSNLINALCCCWFIDPNFQKNKKYYLSQIGDELYYGKEIEYFLEKVFGDNRCEGLYDFLQLTIRNYKATLSLKSLPLNINYKELGTATLYKLFKNSSIRESVSNIFFDGHIPYKEIYDYAKKARKISATEKLVALLEEEGNV